MKLIPLSRNLFAKIDDHRFEEINAFKWCATGNEKSGFYAVRRTSWTKGHIIFMHRQILGLSHKDGLYGDHINHDTLDNRDENLRVATHAENLRNRLASRKVNKKSRYKGVFWFPPRQCWRVKIGFNRKSIHVGIFESEEAAARAYDDKAEELHGQFCNLNFPR